MLEGRCRGPKPSKWKAGAKVAFESYFAKRSQPLETSRADAEPFEEVATATRRKRTADPQPLPQDSSDDHWPSGPSLEAKARAARGQYLTVAAMSSH